MDTISWAERNRKLTQKFQAGERHIRNMFKGLELPDKIEKRAVFGLASSANVSQVGGADVVPLQTFLAEVLFELRNVSWYTNVIPESFPILRTLQATWAHRAVFSDANPGA